MYVCYEKICTDLKSSSLNTSTMVDLSLIVSNNPVLISNHNVYLEAEALMN